ncbi:MAG: sigma-70 family RNA polymerase sigma factor [Opitutales bacterium]
MEITKASTGTITETTTSPPQEYDASLVERAQKGDLVAFDSLTIKYRQRLLSVIYNMTSNREDAADLTQEAFVKAFRSIGKFKGKSSFFTWLYRIGVNVTLSHLQKNKARRFFSFENLSEEVNQETAFEVLASRSKTERPTLLNELQEKLNEALQKLSNKHRTIVVLFEIEGLSHKQIAEIMKCSEGTVRSRLHYAKQQLQAYLSDYLK